MSVDASPNIFEPLEKSIEDDTIDDVIWVTFNLSAVIKPETFNPPVIWVFKWPNLKVSIGPSLKSSGGAIWNIICPATPSGEDATIFPCICIGVADAPKFEAAKDSSSHLIVPIISPTWAFKGNSKVPGE